MGEGRGRGGTGAGEEGAGCTSFSKATRASFVSIFPTSVAVSIFSDLLCVVGVKLNRPTGWRENRVFFFRRLPPFSFVT